MSVGVLALFLTSSFLTDYKAPATRTSELQVVREEGGAVIVLRKLRATRVLWEHRFTWSGAGVRVETDCTGSEHHFESARPLDVQRGTAIQGHRHLDEHPQMRGETP